MADVEVTVDIQYRPWAYRGLGEGYPSGVWFATASVVHDAAGGVAIHNIVLAPNTGVRSGRLYSVMAAFVSVSSAAAAREFRFTTLGLDPVFTSATPPDPQPRTWEMSAQFNSAWTSPNAASRWGQNGLPPQGIFVGAQNGPTVAGRIEAEVGNVDTEISSVYLSGYAWEPGSVNSPTGLLFPPGGVF